MRWGGTDRAECMWIDHKLTIQNEARGLEQFLLKAFSTANAQALADGAAVYVARPAGMPQRDSLRLFVGSGWRIHQTLVWVKDSIVIRSLRLPHEPILFGYKLKQRAPRSGAVRLVRGQQPNQHI